MSLMLRLWHFASHYKSKQQSDAVVNIVALLQEGLNPAAGSYVNFTCSLHANTTG